MSADAFGQVMTRNDIARDIVAGMTAATPLLESAWTFIERALADVPVLLAELGRIQAALDAARLDRANLLAAIRTTLAASADSEDDPLWYLRDEVESRHMPSGRHREAS